MASAFGAVASAFGAVATEPWPDTPTLAPDMIPTAARQSRQPRHPTAPTVARQPRQRIIYFPTVTTCVCISEERREEAINRLLKPAAPPDSGNGVVVPHEAPDGPPKPKKKGKK